MSSKKTVISKHKYSRIASNNSSYLCSVAITLLSVHTEKTQEGVCKYHTSKTYSIIGYYLNKCVYIKHEGEYYKYRVRSIGANKENLRYQLIGLATPF